MLNLCRGTRRPHESNNQRRPISHGRRSGDVNRLDQFMGQTLPQSIHDWIAVRLRIEMARQAYKRIFPFPGYSGGLRSCSGLAPAGGCTLPGGGALRSCAGAARRTSGAAGRCSTGAARRSSGAAGRCCSGATARRSAGAPPAAFGLRGAMRFAAAGASRWFGAAALAGTTPRPLNILGLEVAAIGGLPWFTVARSARLCWRHAPVVSEQPLAGYAAHWSVGPLVRH